MGESLKSTRGPTSALSLGKWGCGAGGGLGEDLSGEGRAGLKTSAEEGAGFTTGEVVSAATGLLGGRSEGGGGSVEESEA